MPSDEIKVQKQIRMIETDTVEITFHDDFKFDLDSIKRSYKETDDFTQGKRLKRLVICGYNTDITKEARQYGQAENVRLKDNVIAEALVVRSLTQRMITNFYLKFIKDAYPCKAFTKLEDAKAWLKEF